MKTILARAARALALLGALAPAARADLFYVDSVAGNDANGGGSASDAWRTITHALAAVPSPPQGENHTIHVAPGVHDVALGEQFPLAMRPRLRLVGGGPGATTIDGGGAAVTLVTFDASCAGGACESSFLDTLLAGFTLRDAGRAVSVWSDFYLAGGTLEELEIVGISGAAVSTSGGGFGGAAPVEVELRRVRIVAPGGSGLRIGHSGEGSTARARLEDCRIEGAGEHGLDLRTAGDVSLISVTLVRTLVDASAGDGARLDYTNGSAIALTLEDSAVLRSGGDGVHVVEDIGLGGTGSVTLRRATVAANAGAGLRLIHGGSYGENRAFLFGSILAGNGDDLVDDAPSAVVEIERCCIEDGDFAGVGGSFAADPLFLDPAGGDFRLAFGSPCVDAGDPSGAPGLDLDGTPRPLDGDLDTAPRVDVGAQELAPLEGGGAVPLGGALALELFGPAGGGARLFAMRGGPTAPQPTPYGSLLLDRATLWVVGTLPTAPGGADFVRGLGADPALVGSSYTLQALVAQGGAPLALSDSVTVLVVP